MPTETRSGRRTNAAGRNLTLAAVLVPALFSLLGWAMSYVYTVVNSDVTMPDWSVNLLNFAAELLPALRDAVLAAFVAILVYAGAGAGRIAAVSGAAIALNAVFGLISTWFSEGFGEFNPMTALRLALLCLAAALISALMKKKHRAARSTHAKKAFALPRAAVFSALPAAILPVGFAVLDLAEHIGNRGGYSDEVFAEGTVFFLGTLVRRALISILLGAAAAWATAEIFGKPPKKD